MGCVQSPGLGARAPYLLRFTLLVSFNGTLVVVSILEMVMIAIGGRLCNPQGVINNSCGNYGSFLAWG